MCSVACPVAKAYGPRTQDVSPRRGDKDQIARAGLGGQHTVERYANLGMRWPADGHSEIGGRVVDVREATYHRHTSHAGTCGSGDEEPEDEEAGDSPQCGHETNRAYLEAMCIPSNIARAVPPGEALWGADTQPPHRSSRH
jgi:hypothetical protein